MASSGFTRMPVLDPVEDLKLADMVSLHDLLRARARDLSDERDRERVIRVGRPFSSAAASKKQA
jgi:hypothetical protein